MTIAQRIAFFEFVRDIPFHIGLGHTDKTYNCVTKSEMLGHMLAGLGLKTRPIYCTFDWAETPLPPEVLTLPRDGGETHQILQMFNPRTKSWINIDPTWDTALAAAGFPVTAWDGVSDTQLAVQPHIIYSAEETLDVMAAENDPTTAAEHMAMHKDFYQAINDWLQDQRKRGFS